jgi:hypothetical protein
MKRSVAVRSAGVFVRATIDCDGLAPEEASRAITEIADGLMKAVSQTVYFRPALSEITVTFTKAKDED